MPDCEYGHFSSLDAIDDTIVLPNQFPDILANSFGQVTTAVWKSRQLPDSFKSIINPLFCRRWIVMGDVRSNFGNPIDGQGCPNQFHRMALALTDFSAASWLRPMPCVSCVSAKRISSSISIFCINDSYSVTPSRTAADLPWWVITTGRRVFRVCRINVVTFARNSESGFTSSSRMSRGIVVTPMLCTIERTLYGSTVKAQRRPVRSMGMFAAKIIL